MKFAIWGAGQKGKVILSVLGQERISCFIDSNISLHGTYIHDCPVISFDDYYKMYKGDLIIVSMLDYKSLTDRLKGEKIPYVMWENSSRVLENNRNDVEDCYDVISKQYKKGGTSIWGVNVLSILLYDMFICLHKEVFFQDIGINESLKKILIDNGYKFKYMHTRNLLVTDGDWHRAVVNCPNMKITDITDLLENWTIGGYKNLQKFRDVHKNKRCFIVGNGPSLRIADLDRLALSGDICFGTNMIYKLFKETNWRPRYYVVSDMAVLDKYGGTIKKLQLECLFIGNRRTNFWDNCTDKRIHSFNDFRCLDMEVPPFSDDISRCVYSYYTVTYTCIQIAVYMGFKEIYLLGVDASYNGYASNENNHFTENYYDKDDRQKIPVSIEGHFRAYQAAENYARKHGILINNATRGGMLNVFERIEFDDLF